MRVECEIENLTEQIWASDLKNYILYAGVKDKLCKSEDGGRSWKIVWTVPGNPSHLRCVFVDSRGNLFVSGRDTGNFYRTEDEITFQPVLNYSTQCINLKGEIWPMTEDSKGNLYIGEYNGSRNILPGVARIWKSETAGLTWYTVLDETKAHRHFHDIKVRPSNDWVYAVGGDDETFGVLRSQDQGHGWEKIVNLGCYTCITFRGDYVYLGSDNTTQNYIGRFQDNGGSGPFHVEKIFIPPPRYDVNFFWGRCNHHGTLLFGGVVPEGSRAIPIIVSSCDGKSFHNVVEAPERMREWSGSQTASMKFDPDGWLYCNFTNLATGYRIRQPRSIQ